MVVLVAVNVDWAAVLDGLVPSLDGSRAEIAALIAIFGTTVSPYLFFWQASEEVEEEVEPGGAEPGDPVTPEHLVAMRVDVIGGMTSAVAVMFAIIVATGATLHASGITDDLDRRPGRARVAAGRRRPRRARLRARRRRARAARGAGARGLDRVRGRGGPDQQEGLSRHFREARGFYTVIIVSMVLGLALDLGGLDPIRGLYYAAILNGLTAPPLIVVMLILARSRRTLGEQRSGRISTTLVVATIIASVALPDRVPSPLTWTSPCTRRSPRRSTRSTPRW